MTIYVYISQLYIEEIFSEINIHHSAIHCSIHDASVHMSRLGFFAACPCLGWYNMSDIAMGYAGVSHYAVMAR